MVKVYTRGGDRGMTSLFGGKRVDKNSARIKAYGEVDELNSLIGVVIADLRHSRLDRESRILDSRFLASLRGRSGRGNDRKSIGNDNRKQLDGVGKKLLRIQEELFVLGADLATPLNVKVKIPRVTKPFISRLEKEIDKWSRTLPQLKKFILPGGSKTGSELHLTRTVARRAERSIVDLAKQEEINKNVLIYTNRLSDWFFTLARYVNQLAGVKEVPWKGRSKI